MSLSALLKFRKPKRLTLEEYFAKLKEKGLNQDGSPILDPTPVAPPIGYKKTPSMVEIVRDMVRSEKLAQEAAQSGHETFEESEDFDIGDDPELLRSPYENEFDPPLNELLSAGEAEQRRKQALQEAGTAPQKPAPSDQGGAGGQPPAAVPTAPKEP